MEQNEKSLNNIQQKKYLNSLANETNFSPDVIELVKSDLEYGLTQEQTDMYLDKGFDIGQMKKLSECLHKEYPLELFKHLHDNKLTENQMQVALEFYEKGIPVATIVEVAQKDKTAFVMRKLYGEILSQLEKAKEHAPDDSEYVKALVAQMEDVVEKINHQNERYDALNKKLSQIETSKEDDEVRDRLVKDNQDKEAMINHQQDELNKASSTIARLRDDIEKKEKEMKRMSERIESLEDKIVGIAIDNQKTPAENENVKHEEKKTEAEKMDVPGRGMSDNISAFQTSPVIQNGIPVYYQLPVLDASGHVIQRLPIERARKNSSNGMAGLFSKLCFKKKSRADIVKLVVSGDLVPAQLVQIKSAIEKGLTENQLVELINNNISAEKMKEIIEIAVLENSLAD